MNDDLKSKSRKIFEPVFPPELVDRLEALSMTSEELSDTDHFYENHTNYRNRILAAISGYMAEHPEAVISHLAKKTPCEQKTHLQQAINEISEDISSQLETNPYVAPFILFLLQKWMKDTKRDKKDPLSLWDNAEFIQQFQDNICLLGELMMKLHQANNFQSKVKIIRTSTDKIIETYFSEICLFLLKWCGLETKSELTLGQLQVMIRQIDKIEQVLPFMLEKEPIFIRNKIAHARETIVDHANELIIIATKPYSCGQIEAILNKVGMIYSGYLCAKVVIMMFIKKQASLEIKLEEGKSTTINWR